DDLVTGVQTCALPIYSAMASILAIASTPGKAKNCLISDAKARAPFFAQTYNGFTPSRSRDKTTTRLRKSAMASPHMPLKRAKHRSEERRVGKEGQNQR